MNATPLYVGIDGGGTKTTLVVVDDSGAEIARSRTGTSNAAVIGHDAAAATLTTALTELADQCRMRPPFAAAWFGLSGSDRPGDHRRLLPALEPLAASITMTNDAALVLGGLPDGIGVAMVAGTGSIAFGRNRAGERARAGGWGHVFSDEGGGYDLTSRMLRAFAAEVDGRGPTTSLTQRLVDHFGLGEPHEIIAHVYDRAMTKGTLASLSTLVIEEAAKGDTVADDILGRAASALAALGVAAAHKLDLLDRLPLALTGGLLLHNPAYRARLLASLSAQATITTVELVHDPALTAARALAQSQAMPVR
jgi:N-acetylglucosamine kinase-like BadF-type ATPase